MFDKSHFWRLSTHVELYSPQTFSFLAPSMAAFTGKNSINDRDPSCGKQGTAPLYGRK